MADRNEYLEDPMWYVVHTYSGYENKVKTNIDKSIQNLHLEDQILDVQVPVQEVIEVKDGKKKTVKKKLFPGYVLLHMIMNDETWYVIRNTRGVTGFVGPESKPVPLTDEEMEEIRQEDRNCRLVKGQVFLWEGAKGWEDLWDENGVITT